MTDPTQSSDNQELPKEKQPFQFPIPPRGGAAKKGGPVVAGGNNPSIKKGGSGPKPMRKHTTRGR